MFRFAVTSLFALFTFSAIADEGALWEQVNRGSLKTINITQASLNSNANLFRLNDSVLTDILSQEVVKLRLPMPNAQLIDVVLTPILVMEESLAAKYPQILTYKAEQIGFPEHYGRIDYTENGFHGVINYKGQTVYIDPVKSQTSNLYKTYFASQKTGKQGSIERSVLKKKYNEASVSAKNAKTIQKKSLSSVSKQYRIAFSTTGEYSQYHGGTTLSVLSELVTLVNRLNKVFEVELGVTLQLVAESEKVIFLDASTDPFENTDNDIFVNGDVLNNFIGQNDYDIGHVLTTGFGGLAVVAAVCDNNPYEEFNYNDEVIASYTPIKAMGVTGSQNPTNDSFYIDFVAHEIGHQLGADHSFNGQSGICATSRTFYDAFEPGSGSTIMSYAGLCGEENLQNQVDDYFHINSILEMRDYLINDRQGIGQSCGTTTITSNNSPSIEVLTDYHIPANTPFKLDAVASDIDLDSLSYTWEQYDLGPSSYDQESMQDDGLKPIFRSIKSTTESSRTFPKFDSLLSGNLIVGENYATTDRELNFQVTVRDGNGGVAHEGVTLTVHKNDELGFQITYPTSEDYWGEQDTSLVQWNLANSHATPISCDSVSIEFSADNGKTFTQIAANIENSGQAQVTTPKVNTVQARLKINCENNVFFAVSKQAFQVFNSDQPNTKPTILGLQDVSQTKAMQIEDTDFMLTVEDLAINDIDSRFPDAFELFILPGENYTANNGMVTIAENYNGILSLNLQVNDGELDSDIFTLYVDVMAVNDAPVAYNDSVVVNYNSQASIDVLNNDIDIDNDQLVLIDITYSGSAEIEISNNAVLYTPASNFVGVDQFTYVLRDPSGAITRAKVTVEVIKNSSGSGSGGALTWLLYIMFTLMFRAGISKQGLPK
ncbi:reprolysin-like metallopeptidase [Thalassomonas sp. M1454]|uniref:reprolysin-like metallopeptidase n=1 Tax=Thalassomonas sp. M1454 TaxID=2594477 RepID=UPI00117CE171|nr:zinc-dependent metalloprotease family protein [Thalassomonas sp. M1454]TRX52231.1 hypothetical protein FNN08_16175 [Thalassomonas sp. M1454]